MSARLSGLQLSYPVIRPKGDLLRMPCESQAGCNAVGLTGRRSTARSSSPSWQAFWPLRSYLRAAHQSPERGSPPWSGPCTTPEQSWSSFWPCCHGSGWSEIRTYRAPPENGDFSSDVSILPSHWPAPSQSSQGSGFPIPDGLCGPLNHHRKDEDGDQTQGHPTPEDCVEIARAECPMDLTKSGEQ